MYSIGGGRGLLISTYSGLFSGNYTEKDYILVIYKYYNTIF